MRSDVLLMDDRTPVIENGDFSCGVSDDQHVDLILITTKGQWKESPLIGVGIHRFLKNTTLATVQMKRDITVGLAADGYNVKEFSLDNGNFNLDYELNQ